MTSTLAIENYELTLPIGKDAPPDSLKIIVKSNSLRVNNIHVQFDPRRNENPLIRLLEEQRTRVRNIQLLLGEDDIVTFLDYLRNEKNRNCLVEFDPADENQFVLGSDLDTNIEGGPFTVFTLDSFALQSKAFNRIRNQLNLVLDTVFGR